MNKITTIYKDPSGIIPMEHRIDFVARKPLHKKYNFANASFRFDPEKRCLKRLDFLIDENLFFVNLALGCGRASPTWFFQKNGSFKTLSKEEFALVLQVAEDVLNNNPQMQVSFKHILEVLPGQANINVQMFDKDTSKTERYALSKLLKEQNKYIQYAQYYYKKIITREQINQSEVQK